MTQRSEKYLFHLEKDLEVDTREEKNIHIRQALQICVVCDELEQSLIDSQDS